MLGPEEVVSQGRDCECEGNTDDEATTKKIPKEIRVDMRTMSNWYSGYPQSISLPGELLLTTTST